LRLGLHEKSFPYYYLFLPAFAQGIPFPLCGFEFSVENLLIINMLLIECGLLPPMFTSVFTRHFSPMKNCLPRLGWPVVAGDQDGTGQKKRPGP
jgi:hypothetical protein